MPTTSCRIILYAGTLYVALTNTTCRVPVLTMTLLMVVGSIPGTLES